MSIRGSNSTVDGAVIKIKAAAANWAPFEGHFHSSRASVSSVATGNFHS